jgi:hypothetical protein
MGFVRDPKLAYRIANVAATVVMIFAASIVFALLKGVYNDFTDTDGLSQSTYAFFASIAALTSLLFALQRVPSFERNTDPAIVAQVYSASLCFFVAAAILLFLAGWVYILRHMRGGEWLSESNEEIIIRLSAALFLLIAFVLVVFGLRKLLRFIESVIPSPPKD